MVKAVYCQGICKDYGIGDAKVRVLDNINISIEKSTLTLIKGRSGSGKTTLMNILGILDNQTEGKVFYNDKDITELSMSQKDKIRRLEIAFIFQSVSLLPHMSAYDNVEFMLRIAKLPIDKKRIEYCLELVGLKDRMKHMAPLLSGGEQQRVAIARAMIHKPTIIFADEPTSQLDSKNSIFIMEIFKQYIREENSTILVTSHDAKVAKAADCIYTMEDGQITDICYPGSHEPITLP